MLFVWRVLRNSRNEILINDVVVELFELLRLSLLLINYS
jgi:hypothetical protein